MRCTGYRVLGIFEITFFIPGIPNIKLILIAIHIPVPAPTPTPTPTPTGEIAKYKDQRLKSESGQGKEL